VCAQPAERLKCSKCKVPYCSVACQTVDWKERGHKVTCKRLVQEAAARGEAPTPPPSPTAQATLPVVEGPARGRDDAARAKAAAAAANATDAPAPESEHWLGTPRCPVCLEDWDGNGETTLLICCFKHICSPCFKKIDTAALPCPLCRTPFRKSKEESLAMLRRQVENDHPAAVGFLGTCYERGHYDLTKDAHAAVLAYRRAAELGDVRAMVNLGFAYDHGEGVKLDKKKAVKYYRMAADRGYASAQYNLGACFTKGDGVAQDYAEAFRFSKLAADQGYACGETSLGWMYERGRGVAQNSAEAVRWYERAAAKGHEAAAARLAELRP